MTATVGIMAYADTRNKKIVLASDSQLNEVDEADTILSRTVDFNKIAYGSYWAMSFSGTFNKQISGFFRLIKHKSNEPLVEKAVKEKSFQEVIELNRKICRLSGLDNVAEFLLATIKPEIGLYFVDSFGNVLETPVGDEENSDYIALGSGKKFIKNFLEGSIGNRAIDQEGITPGLAVRLAYDSIDKNDDPGTGGPIELFMLGEDGIKNYGERLRKAQKKALKDELEAIMNELSPKIS